jgi:hypothetical protein
MYRKEVYELLHSLLQRWKEDLKFLEVLPNKALLLIGLLEKAISNYVFYVITYDENLLKTVLYPLEAIGDELEVWAVKYCLLYTGNEAKLEVATDFSQFAKKTEVKYELLVFLGPEEIQ